MMSLYAFFIFLVFFLYFINVAVMFLEINGKTDFNEFYVGFKTTINVGI